MTKREIKHLITHCWSPGHGSREGKMAHTFDVIYPVLCDSCYAYFSLAGALKSGPQTLETNTNGSLTGVTWADSWWKGILKSFPNIQAEYRILHELKGFASLYKQEFPESIFTHELLSGSSELA